MRITRVFLVKNHQFLVLFRRYTDGPHAGKTYALLPGGKVEAGEEPCVGAYRETKEEIGVRLRELTDLDPVIVTPERRIDFFRCDVWEGEPRICEPEKFSGMAWCPLILSEAVSLALHHKAEFGDGILDTLIAMTNSQPKGAPMVRPTLVSQSPLLRAYVREHFPLHTVESVEVSLILDHELPDNALYPIDLLCVGVADGEDDDYFIQEVVGHPEQKPLFVSPNFNPDHDDIPPFDLIPMSNGDLRFQPSGLSPANFYGKYVDSIDEALSLIVQWYKEPNSIPKEYNQPKPT